MNKNELTTRLLAAEMNPHQYRKLLDDCENSGSALNKIMRQMKCQYSSNEGITDALFMELAVHWRVLCDRCGHSTYENPFESDAMPTSLKVKYVAKCVERMARMRNPDYRSLDKVADQALKLLRERFTVEDVLLKMLQMVKP